MIYLDYAANSPVDKEVLDIFYKTNLEHFANPNSFHKLGLEAKELLNQASKDILKYLDLTDREIIYTSGATESNNLAIKGICERYKSQGKHIIIGAFEHNSITVPVTTLQQKGFEVDVVPVDHHGLIDLEELQLLLQEDTILVSICAVDSELGIRQPIEQIAKIIKQFEQCCFHVDASQAIGKVNIDYSDVDLITLTPHKFYGLEGFGALIKKMNIGLKPLLEGGRSTTIYRSGTPCLSGAIAMAKAIEIAITKQSERSQYVQELNQMIYKRLSVYSDICFHSNQYSIPYIMNLSIKNIKVSSLMTKLENHEIYISTKTSCCPQNTPSKIIYAYTHNKSLALSSMRISLSHLTTKKDIQTFLDIFEQCYKECKNGKI